MVRGHRRPSTVLFEGAQVGSGQGLRRIRPEEISGIAGEALCYA